MLSSSKHTVGMRTSSHFKRDEVELAPAADFMAEIMALQQEVDEFRGKYEREAVNQAAGAGEG